ASSPRPAPHPVTPSQFDPDDERISPYTRTAPAIDARLRGDLVHRLLHRLPDVAREKRREAALGFLASVAPELSAADRTAFADEAIRIVGHPDLAALFGPQSRAEVDLLAHLGK